MDKLTMQIGLESLIAALFAALAGLGAYWASYSEIQAWQAAFEVESRLKISAIEQTLDRRADIIRDYRVWQSEVNLRLQRLEISAEERR